MIARFCPLKSSPGDVDRDRPGLVQNEPVHAVAPITSHQLLSDLIIGPERWGRPGRDIQLVVAGPTGDLRGLIRSNVDVIDTTIVRLETQQRIQVDAGIDVVVRVDDGSGRITDPQIGILQRYTVQGDCNCLPGGKTDLEPVVIT